MGIFGRGKGGGLMNVIRCDLQDYLIWKWRPLDQELNSTSRENAIRYGSSLRVKEGEVAVFVYNQKDGTMMDFIEGPFDKTIQTANFPVLTSIVGLAYGGESPFQADIYFINIQKNNQLPFTVPYFNTFDPRFPDFPIPMAVRGRLTFSVSDYREFIKLNRMVNFELEQFETQIKNAIIRYVKGAVIKLPAELGIPLIQIETMIEEVNNRVSNELKPRLENDFGVSVRGLDISSLDIDRESETYGQLYQLTAQNLAMTVDAQARLNIKNMEEMQAINAENMDESLRIQREELQYAQHLQNQQNFRGAYGLGLQADVLKTGAQNLGQMGNINMNSMGSGGNGGGGLNPAGLMTGMMFGGALGGQMAGMMNQMGQQMQGNMTTPPPIPSIQFMVVQNGSPTGPYDLTQIQQLISQGVMLPTTLVWKQGMDTWKQASTVAEIAQLFSSATPPVPPNIPPIPTL